MKTITIEGKFSGSVNNSVTVSVYQPGELPSPHDFIKKYTDSFSKTLDDRHDDTAYRIEYTGSTTGTFDLKISGQFNTPNPITDSFSNEAFQPGYQIHTT